MDVVRAVAEAVGAGLRRLSKPYDQDNPAHNGYEADEEVTAGFAYVVQATPCHGQIGKQHCSAENAADPRLKRQDAGEQENKQSPPPEFGTTGTAVEVHILADAGLDGAYEVAGGRVLRGLLPGTPGASLRLLWLLPLSLRTALRLLPLIVVIRIQNIICFIRPYGQPLIPLIFTNAYYDTIIAENTPPRKICVTEHQESICTQLNLRPLFVRPGGE